MFERFTWPLRKVAWKFEEKVIWRIADTFRRGPSLPRTPRSAPSAPEPNSVEAAISSAWPTPSSEPAIEPTQTSSHRRLSLPRIRFAAPVRDVSIVLATVAVAIGVGIGAVKLLGPSGASEGNSPTPAPASAAVPQGPVSAAAGPARPSTLQGVTPDFKDSSQQASNATATTDAQVSPTQGTNAKPSSIPPGVAQNVTAIHTARDFAGAFVLYEVGESDAKVRKTFARTATPALARALRERPPRLPDAVSVPTAKVQNVVLGARQGRHVDASVSLLRVGDLSELRLDLIKRQGAWAVSEVRG
jgi:hypothetical protein